MCGDEPWRGRDGAGHAAAAGYVGVVLPGEQAFFEIDLAPDGDGDAAARTVAARARREAARRGGPPSAMSPGTADDPAAIALVGGALCLALGAVARAGGDARRAAPLLARPVARALAALAGDRFLLVVAPTLWDRADPPCFVRGLQARAADAARAEARAEVLRRFGLMPDPL